MDRTSNFQHWKRQQFQYGEAIHFNPISISFCLFFFFLLLLLKLFRGKKQSINFPPSPPKLPIIGNLHQLGTLPHQSLASLSKKYGPLMLLKLGQTPTLVVSSAKMAREVMKTHDLKFSNRPKTTATNLLFYGCQDMGFAPYGAYWRQARKMCVLELFSFKRVESFQYIRDEEVGVLISRIHKACAGGEVVNLSKLFLQISNNIVSRCVMGKKFEDENGNNRFRDVSRRVIELLSAFCVADFFPAFGWVDVVRGFIGELKTISRTMDEFLDRVIEEHKTELRTGKPDDKRDFLDIMLQLNQDIMLDYHFTPDNLKAILQDMFAGGSDTSATALEWAMAELIRNPNTLKKVQEEIRTIVGKKPKIEMNDISKMEYMKCVIKESLRLHPPIPLLVPRETSDVVDIEGYHVASGTSVFVNAWAIQRDPTIWERPNEFIPERFMEKNCADFKGLDFEFIPFGSGRRKCPGLSFALASFECVLANLLYWFDWKLPEDMAGELLDMSELHGITVRKKNPLHLTPLPL
ncbi:cytochrome P450 71A1-like [Cucurbita pepo subsp. pepo]|uniref:cytochrome P450 71A1-like n=1 Tax=Cucurbita pepo subsp. pepo TaxID=3664 RepID=UPI000C9D6F75|nr:cytochrome P450 71A1-like [Cucurbita pepo subsp. pepo]